jgi:hypothetical protein
MKLGKVISAYMLNNGYSLREMATAIECDHTTLHRLVRGEPCRMDTLMKVLVWLIKEEGK